MVTAPPGILMISAWSQSGFRGIEVELDFSRCHVELVSMRVEQRCHRMIEDCTLDSSSSFNHDSIAVVEPVTNLALFNSCHLFVNPHLLIVRLRYNARLRPSGSV